MLILFCLGFPVPGPPGIGPPGMAPPGLAPPGLTMSAPAFIAPPGTIPEPPGQGMKHAAPPMMEEEDAVPTKKQRTEESLIPESEFLSKYKVCITLLLLFLIVV